MNTRGLARLAVRLDREAMRLRISRDGAVLADEALDGDGRKRLCAALERYVPGLAENLDQPFLAEAANFRAGMVASGAGRQIRVGDELSPARRCLERRSSSTRARR